MVKTFLLAASKTITQIKPKWLSGEQELLAESNMKHHITDFANSIVNGNRFEGCAFNINNFTNRLNLHYDQNQPEDPTQSCVLGFNYIHLHHRYGGVAYQRKSCRAANKKEIDFHSVMNFLDKTMQQFPEDRKHLTPSLRNGRLIDVFPGFQIISNKCNLDPSGYHNIFMYGMIIMYQEFRLSIPDLISIQSAIDVIPHTGIFFIMACNIILHYCGLCENSTCHPMEDTKKFQEYELGYCVAKVSIELFYEYKECKQIGKSSTSTQHEELRRCAYYGDPTLPSVKEWKNMNNYKLGIVLSSMMNERTNLSKTYVTTEFKTLLSMFTTKTQGVGELFGLHGISILSKVGILQYEYSQTAIANPRNKAFTFFQKVLSPGITLSTRDECQRFLNSVASRYQTNLSYAENLLCKAYRIRKNILQELEDSEKKDDDGDMWTDLILPFQPIYKMNEPDQNNVMFPWNGSPISFPSGSILKKFPYEKDMITMNEVVRRMCEKGIKIHQRLSKKGVDELVSTIDPSHCIWKDLFFPTTSRVTFDEEIQTKRMCKLSKEFVTYIEEGANKKSLLNTIYTVKNILQRIDNME